MKRIIIAGAHSYIGENLKSWLEKTPEEYTVREISLRDPDWCEQIHDCDALVHVAAIVHKRESSVDTELYFKINRDQVEQCARVAREAGVRQFVFLSSMSVYGVVQGRIDANSSVQYETLTNYGRSKLEGEERVKALENENFAVAIVRPPMVFGKKCRGNYPKLSKLAQTVPFFPKFTGERSMLYIDHLCEALRLILDAQTGGYFFPQDADYYNVAQLMKWIAQRHHTLLLLLPGLNTLMNMLSRRQGVWGKVFGTLTYSKELPGAPGHYQLYSNLECVQRTEEWQDEEHPDLKKMWKERKK